MGFWSRATLTLFSALLTSLGFSGSAKSIVFLSVIGVAGVMMIVGALDDSIDVADIDGVAGVVMSETLFSGEIKPN